jgi:hypothetical protein
MAAPKGNKLAKGNKGGGRRTVYKPSYAAQAAKACQAGFTDRELSALFGVSEVTINNWKLAHHEFALALKAAKEPADERVTRSLYQRANGYTYDSEKVFCNAAGEVTKVPIKVHVPPDTGACIFWLKNRRKDIWRERPETEQTLAFDPNESIEISSGVGSRRSTIGGRRRPQSCSRWTVDASRHESLRRVMIQRSKT